MNKLLAFLFTGLVAASAAQAQVGAQITIGNPAPVYVQPAPVMVRPAPVLVQPGPVVVQPAPRVVHRKYRHDNGLHRGHYKQKYKNKHGRRAYREHH